MRYLLLFLFSILLISCQSKLDKKENEPLILDLEANKQLTIAPEAFISNAINYDFLKNDCRKISQNSNEILYIKDGSSVLFKDKLVQEVHIKSDGLFLNYNIKVGQSKADFKSTFKRLNDRNSNPYVNNNKDIIRFSCCIATESVWEFEFENDILTSIDYVK